MKDTFWNIQPHRKKAMMLVKRQLTELVYDAVNLEGIYFTLPEIQTLLDGITVGGHRLEDQQIAINQANTWKELFSSFLSGSAGDKHHEGRGSPMPLLPQTFTPWDHLESE